MANTIFLHLLTYAKRAAEAGEVEAQVEFALCLQTGDGVKQDESLAREWLSTAAAAGNLQARYELAEQLLANMGELTSSYNDIDNPSKKAIGLLKDCVQHGHLDAMLEVQPWTCCAKFSPLSQLCRLYRTGNWAIKANRTEAIRLYKSLLDKNEDPDIALEFATLLLKNKYRDIQTDGRDKTFVEEIREGLKWLRFASNNDVEGAEKALRDAHLQFSRFLNMQEVAYEYGAGLEHLNISHPAHRRCGRLRITLMRPRNLPNPWKSSKSPAAKKKKKRKIDVYVTLESERNSTSLDRDSDSDDDSDDVDNYEQSWDGVLGVRWTKVHHSSRLRNLKLTGGHGMRETPISNLEVQTKGAGFIRKVPVRLGKPPLSAARSGTTPLLFTSTAPNMPSIVPWWELSMQTSQDEEE
eukprot:764027-Hanusia_phi.AAC.13